MLINYFDLLDLMPSDVDRSARSGSFNFAVTDQTGASGVALSKSVGLR